MATKNRKWISLFGLLIIVCTTSAQEAPDSVEKIAKIKFKETTFNYGQLEFNGDGYSEFVFVNEGKSDLVLTNVKSSCGCTVAKWPKEPIPPGKKSSIAVKYDTSKPGSFNKSIIVYSNGSKYPVVLKIKGNVIK
ncbi:MAG: DUF1573 domain-containing protein [Bacteroidales bacterium]|nr:DUF1573 domain-containing protein [Bacteroidales bacterium]MBN2819935.1 DUF1573 domain-containing protein [Bacteroidales bacterium]